MKRTKEAQITKPNLSATNYEMTYLYWLQESPDGVPVAVDALFEVLIALILKTELSQR